MEQTQIVSPSDKGYTYFAFISYKSEDEKWARWLKNRLQRYRLPIRARRRGSDVPERCSPVFLDKTNLTPGVLDESLRSEVAESRFLIVICSCSAHAKSDYLNMELGFFLDNGGSPERIIPFIVDESRDPVAECFPTALAELCREKVIVGVNVHDAGKKAALLKVVAAMCSLKLEELDSDDKRRARKTRIAGIALAVLLLAAAIVGADYFRVKTDYYVDYTEVWGVPVGIGKLTKAEAQSMSAHYAIKRSRGKVIELRHENAYGELKSQDDYNSFGVSNRPVGALYTYIGDRLDSVTHLDASGQPILQGDYLDKYTVDLQVPTGEGENTRAFSLDAGSFRQTAGALSYTNIDRFLLSYDEAGHNTAIRYSSGSRNDAAADAEGVGGMLFELDALGRCVRAFTLGYVGRGSNAESMEDYAILTARDGVAGIAFAYNDSFDLSEAQYIGPDGEAVTGSEGWSCCVMEFRDHNMVRRSYYAADGAPTLNSYGYAAEEREYDSRGNPVRRRYLDADGAPTCGLLGFAGWRAEYDELGNQCRRSYYGADGEGVLTPSGYAETVISYQGRNLIRQEYRGLNGEAVLTAGGYAAVEYEYDEHRITAMRYYGADGESVMMAMGAEQRIEYTRGGKIRRISCFGTDGAPALNARGYAIEEREYDKYGNCIYIRYLDPAGKAVLCADGYAALESLYDEQGRELKRTYLGLDGEAVVGPEGYAIRETELDADGRAIGYRLYDAEHNAVDNAA